MEELTLWTAADGILETHVTWEDVEESISEKFGKPLKFGPNRTFKQIGDGNGFLSKIALVNADWEGDSDGVPDRFVLKISSCLTMKKVTDKLDKMLETPIHTEEEKLIQLTRFAEAIKHMHNTELNVYNLMNIHKKPDEELHLLDMIFQKAFSPTNKFKGFVGFEYVDDLYLRHVYHNIKPSDLPDVFRTLAKLQIVGRRPSTEEKKTLPNLIETIYESLMQPPVLEALLKSFLPLVKEETKVVIEQLTAHLEELTDISIVGTICDNLGMEPVFIHGDLWASNIMWKRSDCGIEFVKMIDYQIAHYGCPAEDLIRLMISTLSGQDFEDNFETLLEQFYEILLEELNGDEPPYTLEQLKESSYRLMPMTILILLSIVKPIAEAGIESNSGSEDEENPLKVLGGKADAGLAIVLKYHLRNLSLKKE